MAWLNMNILSGDQFLKTFRIYTIMWFKILRESLVAQWLGHLQALTDKGPGSIPGWGIKIPQVKLGG